MNSGKPLRIGVLGCASVADYALVAPAKAERVVEVAAVTSRDAGKAARWAAERGVPVSHGSYAALLRDPRIEAVYIALPNALHCEWTLRALDAGLPVLCEKPLAANAAQADEMVRRAAERGLTLFSGFHWKHHPLAARMLAIVGSGVLGPLRRIEVGFNIPSAMVAKENIRNDFALAGGTTMDTGSYCVNLMRQLVGGAPDVISAVPVLVAPQVDGAMRAVLRFPDDIEGMIDCSMIDTRGELSCHARIEGDDGTLEVHNPFLTQMGTRLAWRERGEPREEVPLLTPSYNYQARAFAHAVRNRLPGDGADGAATMRVIDAIYRKAGLEPRR